MKYIFDTTYNQKALSVMAKCIRKTARKARSKKSHVLGWIVVAAALLLSFVSGDEEFSVTLNKIITWAVAVAIIMALIFEDQLNGYFARKRLLKGTEKALSTFDTDNASTFISETAIGKSEFSYDKIALVADTDEYFVFVFSASHAQIYDKRNLSGGSVDEFKAFIHEKTDQSIVFVK